MCYLAVLGLSILFYNAATADIPTLPPNCADKVRNGRGQGNMIGDIVENGIERAMGATSGIYLLLEPVPFDGTITRLRALGLPDEEEGSYYYVEPRTFRLNKDKTSYRLINQQCTLHCDTFDCDIAVEDTAEDCFWDVKKGDRIGVEISYYNCSADGGCPLHINLNAGNKCYSALYYGDIEEDEDDIEEDEDDIEENEDDIEEVHILLNLKVWIKPSDRIIIIVLVVCPLFILCLVLVVVIVVMCLRIQRSKPSTGTLYSQQETELTRAGTIPSTERDEKNSEPTGHDYNEIVDAIPISGYQHLLHENSAKPVTMSEVADHGYALLDPDEQVSKHIDEGYEVDSGHYDFSASYFEPASREEDLLEQLGTKLAVPTIPLEDLELCEVLGSGAFGTVYRGVWSHHETDSQVVKEEVAVKTIDQGVDETEKVKFLQEATIMAQFKHSNIVRIRGIAAEEKGLMLVLDLLKGGDLRLYLLTSVKNCLESLDPLELGSTLLSYTRQVALGMMSLVQKSYVHRDLAARNILVSEDGMTCKIADFGLSRDLHEENFYISHGGKIPVKWTAPEALQYRCYSSASDVWSYGCVLYEIWSLGEKPFHDMTNSEAMKYIADGCRLPPPPGCPRVIYDIIIKSWHPSTEERPCFSDITQQLQQPDFHILKWSADDVNLYSKEARTIGAALHLGKTLFRELQDTYKASKYEE